MLNNKHMFEIHTVWAWAFDGIANEDVRIELITNYCNQLRYSDPVSADEIAIFMYLPWIKQPTFGDQLQIPIDNETPKTRI